MESLYLQLRQALEVDGRSAAAIANASGVHAVSLSAFLNKRRGLTVESCEKLADALGFDVRLMRRDGTPATLSDIPPATRAKLAKGLRHVLDLLADGAKK